MKFIKRSRFSEVSAREYADIPAHAAWIENVVSKFFVAHKILQQGWRIDLGDIVRLVFLPVEVLLALLFSGVAHVYSRKKFYERYQDTDQLDQLYILHASFYTLDWKRYFSNSPNSWDQY